MKSMRAERGHEVERRPLTGPERALVIAVVVAVQAGIVWFLFFAGSPIG